MRRILLVLLLPALLLPTAASAAGWHTFLSKPLGLAIKYPPGWKATAINQAGNKQLDLIYAGKVNYSLTVLVLPFRPGANISASRATFVNYESNQLHISSFKRLGWTPLTIGGHPALAGIVSPPTEGGVKISNAVYLVSARRSVFEINAIAYHRLSQLSQFPAIYRQILATWRFV
jgi:hypothetical protein